MKTIAGKFFEPNAKKAAWNFINFCGIPLIALLFMSYYILSCLCGLCCCCCKSKKTDEGEELMDQEVVEESKKQK